MGPKVAGGPDPRSAAGNVLSIDGRHCACARALPGDRVSTTHATGCCGRSRPIGRRTGPITSFACSLSKPHADFHSVPEITDADVECLGALRTSATNRPSRRHPQAHRPQAPPLLVGRVAPSRQLTDMAARRRVPLRMRWSPAPPRRHLRSRTDPKDPPAPRSASRSAPGRSGPGATRARPALGMICTRPRRSRRRTTPRVASGARSVDGRQLRQARPVPRVSTPTIFHAPDVASPTQSPRLEQNTQLVSLLLRKMRARSPGVRPRALRRAALAATSAATAPYDHDRSPSTTAGADIDRAARRQRPSSTRLWSSGCIRASRVGWGEASRPRRRPPGTFLLMPNSDYARAMPTRVRVVESGERADECPAGPPFLSAHLQYHGPTSCERIGPRGCRRSPHPGSRAWRRRRLRRRT